MNPTKPEQTTSPTLAPVSDARRKLIRAGLASGPVIATLASPSVFATDCVAPSQTLSAAKSHATTQLGNCSAPDSCDTWKAKLSSTSCSSQEAVWRDTQFHAVFTTQGSATGCRLYKTGANNTATPMTFLDVLNQTSTDTNVQLSRQFVAAYLNICSNKVLFPVNGVTSQASTAQAVVTLWNEWASKGSYTPYGGATAWGNTKIKQYLTNFQP